MKIGTIQILHWEHGRTASELYKEALAKIAHADQLGFYSAWLTEHHFPLAGVERPGYSINPDPLTFLSHAAALTDRIRLGTGVMVLPWDDPVRIAERAAMLDIFSDGRLELGVGRGGAMHETKGFHVPSDHSRERFGEALDVLVNAWKDGPFTLQGEFQSHEDLNVFPKPVQSPPPIYVAATSPESFAWIGRRGLPYCYVSGAWEPVETEVYQRQHRWYLEGAEEAGHDVSTLRHPQVLLLYCAETEAEAVEVAERHVAEFLRFSESHYQRGKYYKFLVKMFEDRAVQFPEYYKYVAPPRRPTNPDEAAGFAKEMILRNLIGTPDSIVEKLNAYRESMTLDYLLAFTDWGAIPHDRVMRSMELFAESVMPRFVNGDHG
jgi:alkanesulfonate monooxygenase SsuD/methylene tetrahydromethanopterin reductase-like flavin-dependent oxidoreductase (luciferase family)